jgi:hypothetical protein
MTTTQIQILLDDVSCVHCLTDASLADMLKIALLNQISAGGGGADALQAQSGNYAGGQPTWTPTSAVGVAFDTSTNPSTQWWYYGGAWH